MIEKASANGLAQRIVEQHGRSRRRNCADGAQRALLAPHDDTSERERNENSTDAQCEHSNIDKIHCKSNT